jgi:hypothetical protein
MAKMASMYAEQFEIPAIRVGETISWGRFQRSYTISAVQDLRDGKLKLTLVSGTGKVSSGVVDPQVFVRRR